MRGCVVCVYVCVFACPCLTLLVQLIGFFFLQAFHSFSLIFLSDLQLSSVIGALSIDVQAHVCATCTNTLFRDCARCPLPIDSVDSVFVCVCVLLQLEIYLLPSCFHCWPGRPHRCE